MDVYRDHCLTLDSQTAASREVVKHIMKLSALTHISLRAILGMFGITRSIYWSWERGYTNPSAKNCRKLREVEAHLLAIKCLHEQCAAQQAEKKVNDE